MSLTREIIRGSYLLALIKKVLMENLNLLIFPTYVTVNLIKSKLQIHPVNPTNPDILKFITKVLWIKYLWKLKICSSFTRSLKFEKIHAKMLDIMEFIN